MKSLLKLERMLGIDEASEFRVWASKLASEIGAASSFDETGKIVETWKAEFLKKYSLEGDAQQALDHLLMATMDTAFEGYDFEQGLHALVSPEATDSAPADDAEAGVDNADDIAAEEGLLQEDREAIADIRKAAKQVIGHLHDQIKRIEDRRSSLQKRLSKTSNKDAVYKDIDRADKEIDAIHKKIADYRGQEKREVDQHRSKKK